MRDALKSVISWYEAAGIETQVIAPDKEPRGGKESKSAVTSADAKPAPKPKPAPRPAASPEPALKTESPARALADAAPLAKGAETLEDLRRIMQNYDAGDMSDHARQMVFSRGNPEAQIMVIGEAPGREEDLSGAPFVGRSGQLLDRIFASIGLDESSLYITNVINWRPPGNRNPTPEEIALTFPFLTRHMELIDPQIIVLVGGVSLTALTGQTGIMKQRGQWTTLTVNGREVPTLPIYHPAFLLRQPALKKDTWRDMLSLQAKMEELALTN